MNWDPLWNALAAWFNNLLISLGQSVATLLWYVMKLIAFITDWFTAENTWGNTMNLLLESLRAILPDVLQSLTFGDGNSPGLMYIALMLAGFLLIIPQLRRQAPLVDTGRILVHGVLLVALFTASTAGFDLIGLAESLRQWATQTVIGAISESGSLSELVTTPMQATTEELTNWDFVLPSAFEAAYFYPPDDSDIETQQVILIDWLLGQIGFELQVETETSLQARLDAAQSGLLMASLTLGPALILLFFGLTFATLAAAALILIIFFLVTLPLGFFEFGADILGHIAQQYAYVIALTLVATIFPGLLLGVGAFVFDGNPTIGDMVSYLPVLIIVGIATHYILHMAFKGLTGSFGMVTAGLSATVGALAFNATMPHAGHMPGSPLASGASRLALSAAAGLVSGGTSALLTAALLNKNEEGSPSSSTSSRPHVFGQAGESPATQLTQAMPGSSPLSLQDLSQINRAQQRYEKRIAGVNGHTNHDAKGNGRIPHSHGHTSLNHLTADDSLPPIPATGPITLEQLAQLNAQQHTDEFSPQLIAQADNGREPKGEEPDET